MSSDIRDSMAQQLWYEAWEQSGARQTERPQRVPGAVAKATRDLEKLYEKMNGVMSLDTLYQRAREQGWEDSEGRPGASGKWNFGKWLVGRALGDKVTWMNVPPMRSFKIPTFKVTFDGDELTWDGSDRQRNHPDIEEDLGINPGGREEIEEGLETYDKDVSGIDRYRQMKRATPREVEAYRKQGLDKEGLIIRKRNPCHGNPTKTVAETRKLLAARPWKCGENCPGWAVFDEGTDRCAIQRCDECMEEVPKHLRVSDDDVAQLPEAKAELAAALEVDDEMVGHEVNPPVQWYRVSWPGDSAVYPSGPQLDSQLRYLRSKGYTDHDITVKAETVRSRPPGVPNRSRAR